MLTFSGETMAPNVYTVSYSNQTCWLLQFLLKALVHDNSWWWKRSCFPWGPRSSVWKWSWAFIMLKLYQFYGFRCCCQGVILFPRTNSPDWSPYIRGTQRQFSENICSEDDLRSRIFGTFVVKFLVCLPLQGFSNPPKVVWLAILTDFYPKKVF